MTLADYLPHYMPWALLTSMCSQSVLTSVDETKQRTDLLRDVCDQHNEDLDTNAYPLQKTVGYSTFMIFWFYQYAMNCYFSVTYNVCGFKHNLLRGLKYQSPTIWSLSIFSASVIYFMSLLNLFWGVQNVIWWFSDDIISV